MTLFPKVAQLLREKGAEDIAITAGGIIPDEDVPKLKEAGITEIFGPGTALEDIIKFHRNVVRK